MRIYFETRTLTVKSATIYVKMKGQNIITVKTPLKVDPKLWTNKDGGKVRPLSKAVDYLPLNTILKNLRNFLTMAYNKEVAVGQLIDKYFLRDSLDTFFKVKQNANTANVYFLDYAKDWYNTPSRHIYKSKRITANSLKKYKNMMNHFEAYEKKKRKKVKHIDMSLAWYYKFLDYMTTKNLSRNYQGVIIQSIKSIASRVRDDKIKINTDVWHNNFIKPREKANNPYLKEATIKKILDYNFTDDPKLLNARNLLIIGCRTGLRVSDLMRTNIDPSKDHYEITTQKTGKRVVIPLHKDVKTVINDKGGYHGISDVNFNKYIKTVCRLVGLNEPFDGSKMNPETHRKEKGTYPLHELVTSHICRRSFATNLYNKIPTSLIMSVTGHTSESSFLAYIKTTSKENANEILKYWSGKDKPKDVPKTPLKVVK